MATLDFDMTGVKPAGEFTELQEGEYLVRIEGTEKKGTKDKFYEDGRPHEDNGKNFYLNIGLKVCSGPDEGRVEMERLNLWNTNALAVNIAKSTLKSIQDATGVYSNDSDHFHGKFMVMTIKKNSKGVLGKHYSPAPEGAVAAATKPIATVAVATPVATQAAPAGGKPSWAL